MEQEHAVHTGKGECRDTKAAKTRTIYCRLGNKGGAGRNQGRKREAATFLSSAAAEEEEEDKWGEVSGGIGFIKYRPRLSLWLESSHGKGRGSWQFNRQEIHSQSPTDITPTL